MFSLVRALFVIFIALTTMVFHSSYFQFTGSIAIQIFNAAMALAGLPLLLVAFWAVVVKAEAPIRLYVYYMVASLSVDVFFIVKDLVISGPCQNLPEVVAASGAAFACGMARVFNSVTIFFILGVELYFIFVVMSYCEELSLGGGPDLSDLAYYNDPKRKFVDSIDEGGYYDTIQDYGAILESSQQVLGGSVAIFGESHELRYPPAGAH